MNESIQEIIQEVAQEPKLTREEIIEQELDKMMALKGPQKRDFLKANIEYLLNTLQPPKGRRSGARDLQEANITEARAIFRTAHSKLSRAVTEEAIERAETEIAQAKARLDELIAKAGGVLTELVYLGEDTRRVVQAWVIKKETELREILTAAGLMTDKGNFVKEGKLQMRALRIHNEIPKELLSELRNVYLDAAVGMEAVNALIERAEHSDQRVLCVVRMHYMVKELREPKVEVVEEAVEEVAVG